MTGKAGSASAVGSPARSSQERPAWVRLAVLAAGITAGHVAWFLLLSPDPWVLGFGDLGALPSDRLRLAALLLVAEIAVLLLCVRSVRGAWSSTRPEGIRLRWLLLAVAFHVLAATAVTARPSDYPVHVALTLALLGLSWLTVALAAAYAGTLGMDGVVDRVIASRRTRWWLALGASALAFGINRIVFDGIPHIPDEVVYLLQAKYLSGGSLSVSGIPAGALDMISTATQEGRWFGIFPVGWPALLAVGVKLGAPWLVNPVLTFVAVLAAHGLLERVWDLRTANLGAFFVATSPWMLFLGSSYMAHTASIVVATLAIRGAVEIAGRASVSVWSLAGGAALGVLVLIRPFEGVLIGLCCAGIVMAARRSASLTPGAVAFALVAVAVGGLTLLYNRALTGRALLDPITLYFDSAHYPGANRLGFGADVGNVGWGNDALPGHSPLEALINANWNASLVQLELFGWAFGSLAVVLIGLTVWRQVVDERMVGALSVVGTLLAAYTLYWYSAADFGPRYWSQMIVPFSAFTAVSLLNLPGAAALRRMAVLASLLGMPVVVAMRGTIKYRDYRGMTRDVERLAEREGFQRDLVLIRGDVFSDYSPGLILNPPDLDGPGPLYFRWVGGEDLRVLRERFPGRRVWVVDGASLGGGQPRVVSGPTP